MKAEVFIDTSAFYALLVKQDEAHPKACRFMEQAARDRQRFVTTDYVMDETVTLLKMRGHGHVALSFLTSLQSSLSCRVVWMDPEQFTAVTEFFAKHQDKDWSFTDCFSFTVMRRLKLRTALTKDEHFRAAGFETPLLK